MIANSLLIKVCGVWVMMLFIVTLSGCGGGGGGSSSPNEIAQTPPKLEPCKGIKISTGECLSQQEFKQRRDKIADRHLANREYQNQWGLQRIKAHRAHAALEIKHGKGVKPGSGVTIGIIDTGVNLNHYEFRGANIERRPPPIPGYDSSGYTPDRERLDRHGTAVTSIIAAQANGTDFIGVAPGAAVKMFPISPGSFDPDRLYAPASMNALASRDGGDAQILNTVFAEGIDILNLSIGRQGLIENYSEQELRGSLPQTIAALAQAGKKNKTVLVWAAGNDHGSLCAAGSPNCRYGYYASRNEHRYGINASSPFVWGAGLAARLDELAGHSIAVVATDKNGTIADFSNRCGIAKDICIAAPGVNVSIATGRDEVGTGDGTSAAAPMVSGGLALMKHFFRDQLSHTDLVTRLFDTADKDGRYRDQSIYGQGLMDLEAAVSPVGAPTVTTGNQVGDADYSLQATSMSLGHAFGDGLSHSLLGQEIVAFDSSGAPFWLDLDNFTAEQKFRGLPITQRLHNLMHHHPITQHPQTRMDVPPSIALDQHGNLFAPHRWRTGFYAQPTASPSSLFNLAEQAVTVQYQSPRGWQAMGFTTAGLPHAAPESGAIFTWQPGSLLMRFRTGWLGEHKSMLGSMTDGAFGELAADSFVTGLELGTAFKGWQLAADAEIGFITAQSRGGIISGLSDVVTSAVSLRANRHLTKEDEVVLSISQPPRIEQGQAAFVLPVGRTKDGRVLHERFSADLAPSGRQIDVAARWYRQGVFGGEWRTEMTISHHPGHTREHPDISLLAGWKVTF